MMTGLRDVGILAGLVGGSGFVGMHWVCVGCVCCEGAKAWLHSGGVASHLNYLGAGSAWAFV